MSSRWRRHIASVQSPANGAPRPSATLSRLDRHDLVPRERQRHGVGTAPARRRRRGPVGRRSLTAAATPEISPPPPTPDDHDVDIGQVLDELEADRAVTGDDLRVVERVHERQALGVADPFHLGERLADVRAVEDDPGAVAEAGVDLRADGAVGHDDRDRNAGRATGPRIRLTGVARPRA